MGAPVQDLDHAPLEQPPPAGGGGENLMIQFEILPGDRGGECLTVLAANMDSHPNAWP